MSEGHTASCSFDSAQTEDPLYSATGASMYAAAPWVHEVAETVVRLIAGVRPWTSEDLVFDFGCGPGITLEKIFFQKEGQSDASHPLGGAVSGRWVGRGGFLCDISEDMARKSIELSTIRCPDKGVMVRRLSAFEESGSETAAGAPTPPGLSPDFKAWLELPPRIDIAIASLVAEYLTEPQIKSLTQAMLAKLSPNGVLLWLDWAEHLPYRAENAAGIHHPTGFTKQFWLQLAAGAIASTEGSEAAALIVDTTVPLTPFAPRPMHRYDVHVGTFAVALAHTQRVPSGDTIHYLILHKREG